MGQVKTALLSVYDKTGLADLAAALARSGIAILASGGTGVFLRESGIACEDVSVLTGRNELLGGLVKTLHPAIHAGILADRTNESHLAELEALGYRKIDMVVVNFYALPAGPAEQDLSFIDIGGPAMARAAAKNFRSCVPVPDPGWYGAISAEVGSGSGIGEDLRWRLAADTLARTGSYDARVLDLVGAGPETALEHLPERRPLLVALQKALDLRYGENPHQPAAFLAWHAGRAGSGTGFDVLKGELSYNNILDLSCCVDVLAEFDTPAAVVVKHVGPCGVAQSKQGVEALASAYECDPLSAYGGVVGVNFPFDRACADYLAKRFVEGIVAPGFEDDALAVLSRKKSRLVAAGETLLRRAGGVGSADRAGSAGASGRHGGTRAREVLLRSALGGVLVQQRDSPLLPDGIEFVAGVRPEPRVVEDLLFAWRAAKHVKSNAIVFASGGRTLGIGGGQPSRVDSTRLAIQKAAQAGHDLKGSVLASDGFFPFPDSVELAAQAGAVAVIQPGGSIRDQEVIAAADRLGIAMAVTHMRHFKH